MKLSEKDRKDLKRFWSKVDKTSSPHGCWVYDNCNEDEYGQFDFQGKKYLTHRLSNILACGPIPDGIQVCHNCPGGDNKACVNPDHHFRGTHKQHEKDKKQKGQHVKGCRHWAQMYPKRVARGSRHGTQTHPERVAKGSRNGRGMAKLVESDVKKIREEYATGNIYLKALGKKYKVAENTICQIVNRKTWKHVK